MKMEILDYDQLGFGTGAYENRIRFDPATLRVDQPFRPPRRLTAKNWRDVYQAMRARLRGHGSIVMNVEELVYAELSSYDPAKTHLDAESVTFNLRLSDPVEEQLGDDRRWRGAAGEYIVTLGEECSAQRGRSTGLRTLSASVGAFSRLWLGVRSASSLAVTDDLRGDGALLRRLDRALRPPQPHFGWPF